MSGKVRPWRIRPCTIPSRPQNFRHLAEAYAAAFGVAKQGTDVRIYEFDPGSGWQLHEIVRAADAEPTTPDTEAGK